MTPAKNLIFFGGRPIEAETAEEIETRISEMAQSHRLPMESIALLSTRRIEPWPVGVVLTDDFAPYDLLLGRERSPLAE